MLRNVFSSLLLAVVAALSCGSAIRAQGSTAKVGHYTLLPRQSTLHQSGGFAGREVNYLLTGKYDVVLGTGSPVAANFDNAEVWGAVISPYPTPAVAYDIDQILNLEGLHGQALPVAAPFDVYEFTGKIADGSSIHLFGSVIGPWMYLRGGTTPPPNTADYFTYQLKALARTRPFADANNDGTVDAADYVAMRNNAASLGAEQATLNDWFDQYGESIPDVTAYDTMLSAAVGTLATTAAVPEPGMLNAMIMGMVLGRILMSRIRRRT